MYIRKDLAGSLNNLSSKYRRFTGIGTNILSITMLIFSYPLVSTYILGGCSKEPSHCDGSFEYS